jgi:hypothetical protein
MKSKNFVMNKTEKFLSQDFLIEMNTRIELYLFIFKFWTNSNKSICLDILSLSLSKVKSKISLFADMI